MFTLHKYCLDNLPVSGNERVVNFVASRLHTSRHIKGPGGFESCFLLLCGSDCIL